MPKEILFNVFSPPRVFTILWRSLDEDAPEEREVAERAGFNVVDIREQAPSNSLVIPRYSALPNFDEVVKGLAFRGSWPINSLKAHRWIANADWYNVLWPHVPTPQMWRDLPPSSQPGDFVLKGATNSKKWLWNTHMYAKDRTEAIQVAIRLRQDSMIGEQEIIYKQYVPLKAKEIGINDISFANEWRFFFFRQTLLTSGYYWSCAEEETKSYPPPDAERIAYMAASYISCHALFFVVDIAETQSGDFIVIEVNDGQMSGLSDANPMDLYRNLDQALRAECKNL